MANSKFTFKGTARRKRSVENFTSMALMSPESESVEFNNLQIPLIKTKGVYRFYTEKEDNPTIQENPEKRRNFLRERNITDNPRYIALRWKRTRVRRNIFRPELSIERNIAAFKSDGFDIYITDLHGLNLAFSSLSNDNMFPNTISTYILAKQTVTRRVPGFTNRFSTLIRPKREIVYMNMHNRALEKMTRRRKQLHPRTPSKAAIRNVGSYLSKIKLHKTDPEVFRSLPELGGLEYVGYIVEKERLSKSDGWVAVGTYRVFGSKIGKLRDSLVAYGRFYRYRIRSILRFTTKEYQANVENFRFVENENTQEAQQAISDLQDQSNFIQAVVKASNQGVSYKNSLGSVTQEIPVGNDRVLKVRETFFNLDQVEDTSVPNLNELRLANNLIVDKFLSLREATENDYNKETNEIAEESRAQEAVYNSYYFSGEASNWSYVTVTDKVPPPYPSSILITPNTNKQHIMLTWLNPSGPQRDVKSYKIYFKHAIEDSWELLVELPKDENGFIHEILDVNKKYIYAISCVDIHGLESFLSMQIQAQLNDNFEIEKKEKDLVWVSGGGARPQERGVIYKKFIDSVEPTMVHNRVRLKPKLDFKEKEKTLMVRVTSLDTHESKDFNITLANELDNKPRPTGTRYEQKSAYQMPSNRLEPKTTTSPSRIGDSVLPRGVSPKPGK